MYFSNAAAFVAVVLSALSAKAAYFAPVNSTAIIQCDTIKLSYKGHSPYTVSVWDGCDEDAETDTPKAQYHTNLTTVNWKVNVAAGKSIMFGILDGKGNSEYTDDYTVHPSSDPSCVGKSPSFSSPGPKSITTPTSTVPLGNAGGAPTPTDSGTTTTTIAHHIGGLGGALSNFSPRVELAALVVIGSSLASLFF